MKRLIPLAIPLALVCGACQQPQTRLNAPPHGYSEQKSRMHNMYTHMGDNALLEDMSLNDAHFVPHRPMLNSLGEERLRRLALLMHEYGGTIRMGTDLTNEHLIHDRLDCVIDFLAEAGLDTTADIVQRDLAGGHGMDAKQAIVIRKHEATYDPNRQKSQNNAGMRLGN